MEKLRFMKWFFAIGSESCNFDKYEEMIKVAVISARKNAPSLEPICIFDGPESEFTWWLKDNNVKVIHHRVSFYNDLIAYASESDPNSKGATNALHGILPGVFLRLDLPLIMKKNNLNDEVILYTDCDVLFMKDINIDEIGQIDIFSAAPEHEKNNYDYINTGVMFINVKVMQNYYDELVAFTKNELKSLKKIVAWDQGIINKFFKGRWNKLDIKYNWKPYWGTNLEAPIVHFHGPKPYERDLIRRCNISLSLISKIKRKLCRIFHKVNIFKINKNKNSCSTQRIASMKEHFYGEGFEYFTDKWFSTLESIDETNSLQSNVDKSTVRT